MLQVQRGTWGIWHRNKNKHGKKCNVTFGKDSWSQVSLPIRHGGLRLRSAADLSLPCFLASFFACQATGVESYFGTVALHLYQIGTGANFLNGTGAGANFSNGTAARHFQTLPPVPCFEWHQWHTFTKLAPVPFLTTDTRIKSAPRCHGAKIFIGTGTLFSQCWHWCQISYWHRGTAVPPHFLALWCHKWFPPLLLVHTSWFITTTKGNTIGLGWPRLQWFTLRPARHSKP